MFPFITNLNGQYISDLYATSAYYGQSYYLVPDENATYWNPPHYQENPQFPITPYLTGPIQHQKQENPTRTSQRPTKTKDKIQKESSVSQQGLDESEELSPEVRMRQKYGRNINSNIFHHMLKKILIEEEYEILIVKILVKVNSNMSLPQFKQILSKKMSRLSSYISLNKMKNLFKGNTHKYRTTKQSQQKQSQFCKVFRSICSHYLKNMHILHIFNVLKIKNESKHFHLVGCRRIAELMK